MLLQIGRWPGTSNMYDIGPHGSSSCWVFVLKHHQKEDRASKAHLGDYSAIRKYGMREYATKTKEKSG